MTKREAAEVINRHQRIAEGYHADIRRTKNNISNKSDEKRNLEKRKREVEQVIRKLLNVNGEIGDVNRQAKNTQSSYTKAIRLKEAVAGNIHTAFQEKSIEDERNTQAALQKLRQEVQRITDAISSIQAEINRLQNAINSLQHEIRYCQNVADDYARMMHTLPD